jgi:predicted nucleic-acid-binding protein
MIGIDTNILVRAFLEDDKAQAKASQELMKHASDKQKLFISSYAILEFVWVLKVKKFTRKEVYEAVISLVDSPGVTVGNRDVVLEAIQKYMKGTGDFGDYMIIAEGEENGVHSLKTFDQAIIQESPNITLP